MSQETIEVTFFEGKTASQFIELYKKVKNNIEEFIPKKVEKKIEKPSPTVKLTEEQSYRLKTVTDLYQKEIITKADYEEAKRRILKKQKEECIHAH